MRIICTVLFFFIDNLYSYQVTSVIIDPGHGGKDPGAINLETGRKEKDINLTIALYLKQCLQHYSSNIQVILTRETDHFVSLGARAKKANKYAKNASLFISIHTNSHNMKKKVEGVEVFYHFISNKTIANFRLKSLESEVVKDSDKDDLAIQHIINSKIKEDSKSLAHVVAKNLKIASNEPLRRITASNLYVTSYSIVPSILVEVGFIDSRKFVSDLYKKKLAKGIFLGILKYINDAKSR